MPERAPKVSGAGPSSGDRPPQRPGDRKRGDDAGGSGVAGWLRRNRIFLALFAVGVVAAGYAMDVLSGAGSRTSPSSADNAAAATPGALGPSGEANSSSASASAK